jgi:hypothetical protein
MVWFINFYESTILQHFVNKKDVFVFKVEQLIESYVGYLSFLHLLHLKERENGRVTPNNEEINGEFG